jgi:hypothetical protein
MVDLNRLKEYLQRTQDGINWSLENGDEAAADQYMAQADKLAQVAERVKQQQVAQESPAMPRTQQGVVQPPAVNEADRGMDAILEEAARPPSQDELIHAHRQKHPTSPSMGPPRHHLPPTFTYHNGRLTKKQFTNLPPMAMQPAMPIIEYVAPSKEEVAALRSRSADLGMDEVLDFAAANPLPKPPAPAEERTVTVEAPFVQPSEEEFQEAAKEALSHFKAQYQTDPKSLQSPSDLRELSDREVSEKMGRIYGWNKKGEVRRPKLFSWENFLLFLFSGFSPVMRKYLSEKNDWIENFKKYWDESTKGMRSALSRDLEAERENQYRNQKILAYSNDPTSKLLLMSIQAAEKNISDAKKALAQSRSMDVMADPNERNRAIQAAEATIKEETQRKNDLIEQFKAHQDVVRLSGPNPFRE